MPAASASPLGTRAWHGRLAASFGRVGARTVLARSQVCMPLALQRAFYPEGSDCCHVLVLHPPGGMVDGDRLDIDIEVGPRAEALVTTPSAAKWYRAAHGAVQNVVARVATSAHFEWLPLETIVFNGAQARQQLRIELAAGATFAGWEMTRLGRSARGETFDHGSWRSHTEVWRDGATPLWIDRQQLAGGSQLLDAAYGLAGHAVVGTFVWIGRELPPALIDAIRARWASAGVAGMAGVTRLPHGVVCRYRGDSSCEARACFVEAWDAMRQYARGRPACAPRVWKT
jgi:urease accessory protein